MRRMAFFFSTRRSSLLETYQRFRRMVLNTPLFTTFLRKRFSSESCDSLGRKTTVAMLSHLPSPGKIKSVAVNFATDAPTRKTCFIGPILLAVHLSALVVLTAAQFLRPLLYRNSTNYVNLHLLVQDISILHCDYSFMQLVFCIVAPCSFLHALMPDFSFPGCAFNPTQTGSSGTILFQFSSEETIPWLISPMK